MKNKLILYALNFFLLFSICAYAQDINPGYYRVTNLGLFSHGGTARGQTVYEKCYAYVANGSYHMATGSGAKQNIESLQLWTGIDNAVVSPQTVIYIAKNGSNYNLEAQGTSVSQMTSYEIKVSQVSGTNDTYTLTTNVAGAGEVSLWVDKTKKGRYDMEGRTEDDEGKTLYPTHYQATTTSQGADSYKQWQIVPISTSSDNYVAVKACLKVKDEEDETKFKYYAPYYASYPFKLVSPGMKAYYVSSITDKKYTLQEITNEVIPAATPVIIECPSDKPIDCKIEPLRGNYGGISGNKLKGVFFCNLSMSPKEYSDCRTEFKKESMRVWAVKDDKLILTNNPDNTRAVPLALSGFSGLWLRANESYLADVPSTTAAELVSAGKATTISFDTDGGTEVADIIGGEGEPVTPPANPTKTGHTFTGWNPALPSVFPAEDMTVKAQWQINQYTITFNTNGGTTISPITQNYNTAINKPSDPTKEGYTFAGWDATIPDLMPAENITINALWTTNQYTITFDTDGGTTISPISQDYGTSVTAPANPTKTGYTFVGWDKAVPSTMPAGNVVIKAQWQINQYTITFDTDGGTTISPITQDYNTVITKPLDPTKTGSSFAGWDKEIPSIMPAENLTIKALWTVGKYTITFDTDGGTTIAPISQDYGTSVTAPANPTKTGYTFIGWDKEIPSTMPAGNVVIKANWQINQYTITFDTDGGTSIEPITQDYNTAITKPSDPTKTGYKFTGWDKEIPSTMPAENMTIKAQWQINKHTITYFVDGKEYKKIEDVAYNTSITPESEPTKVGYTFSGWSTIPSTMPDNDVTITGTFSVNQYTITFDTDGGTEVNPITQDYNTAILKPSNPTKDGSVFAGWDKEIPSNMPAENITIKALWKKLYTITFNTDGGTEVASITKAVGEPVTAPANPTKTGYTFASWNPAFPETMPENNLELKAVWNKNQHKVTFISHDKIVFREFMLDYGDEIVAPVDNPEWEGHTFLGWNLQPGTKMPDEDVPYRAIWDEAEFTITFDTDGGSVIAPITQKYGSEITAPANPTKTGYTFVGWDKEIPSTMPAENKTIKAQWQINEYSLKYFVDATLYKSVKYTYNTVVTAEPAPTKEGYAFSGWQEEIPSVMPANDVTVTGSFAINQYTITFDTDGGTEIAPITQDYNTAITKPSAPTRTGYTFTGWDKNIPDNMPAENMTVKALWLINKYTITFDTDGGTVIDPMTRNYNSAIAKPEDPKKEGYTFVGWDKAIPSTMPAENMTIKALWQINQYTITFDTDGGTTVAPVSQDYGTSVTAPANPTKTGYTFIGWSKEIPSVMPAENMTIKAQWQINQYTITFDTDGGTEVAPITQNYNTSIAKPSNPMKEGYTFIGWDKEIPSTMPAENMTIKALWQVNEYSLNYFVDGTLYKSVKYVYNTAVTAEPAAEKIGYTFSGWQEEIPTVMPAKDVTITGTFKINQYTITFDSNGDTEVVSITQDYGTKIKVDAPTKDGYDFAGWDPALPETMPAKNMDLKAIWGPKEVEKEYSLNEGWTWISFYLINPDMSSFDTVLSSLNWNSTDEIKGADTWAIYSAKKKKWVGTMEGFNDLSMYKIHSSYSGQELKLNGGYINSKADQKVSVEKGWNYLPYLSLSDLSVDKALQNYAASEGDILKSQTQSATYSNGQWNVAGGLTSMEPGKGYMLYRSADNKVSFTYPVALEEEKSNSSRAMRFEGKAQRFSSNMNVFATVEGVMAVPGDSIVAVAVDGVRGGATIDNEGKASLTILGDNNADIYLTLMHNNIIVASAKAPISYASDNIVGSYANPTAIEFVEGSEAWSGDYSVTAVYTMDGRQLPTTDIKTLTTGLYIIKYETLSDNNSNTGGCRVVKPNEKYPTDLTAYIQLPSSISAYSSNADEMAAFCGDEPRGEGSFVDGVWCIRIWGYVGEKITLRYYCGTNRYMYHSTETIVLQDDEHLGTFDDPRLMSFDVDK